jgi:5-oxoprolinase (ATP-hydrolysing) subunit A
MTSFIDINADAGESFARWVLGSDSELLPLVTTVNIACGFHAGDPKTMRQSVLLAKECGTSVGAHPGYPDLWGFGRRQLNFADDDVLDYIIFQTGALMGLAAAEGVRLTHVKPHGALYGHVARSPELALRLSDQLQTISPGITLMTSPGPAGRALKAAGHRVVFDSPADLDYAEDGSHIIEMIPQPKDPDVIGRRAVELAQGFVTSVTGKQIEMPTESICVHGDRPNAVELATSVRKYLGEAGVEIRPVFSQGT